MLIRREEPSDAAAIRAVHISAFPTNAEANLVDTLCRAGRCAVSLVAVIDDQIVGHILFTVGNINSRAGLALAPLAVSPSFQRHGIGTALTRAGLDACRQQAAAFVFVLGHPEFYARFGFRRASSAGIGNEYGADDAFMIIELQPNALPPGGGLARYAPEFADLGE